MSGHEQYQRPAQRIYGWPFLIYKRHRRIWEGFNDDSNQAEIIWPQATFGQLADHAGFPGLYFWRVTALMPESMGKIRKGTFVVIK